MNNNIDWRRITRDQFIEALRRYNKQLGWRKQLKPAIYRDKKPDIVVYFDNYNFKSYNASAIFKCICIHETARDDSDYQYFVRHNAIDILPQDSVRNRFNLRFKT